VDELNHVLAARSLLADGTLQLEGGEVYTRGWAFTYLVAGLFRIFGESLVAARVPAVLGGAALVVAVFLWVRSLAGRGAGWIAGLLVCFYPEGIWLSQLSRFYTLQALFFWLGAVCVYSLLAAERFEGKRALGHGACAVGCLGLALHLQILTAAGIVGLLLWAAGACGGKLAGARKGSPIRKWVALSVLSAVFVAVVVVAVQAGVVSRIVSAVSYADAWAVEERGNLRYYHWLFLHLYPTLWSLTPLVFLLAVARNVRAAVFCAVVFFTALLLQSVAAWKAERYIFYAVPMLFALWGMGVAEGFRWLQGPLVELVDQLVPRWLPRRRASAAATVLLAGCVLFAMVGNTAFSYAWKMMVLGDQRWTADMRYRGEPDWAAVRDELGPLVDGAEVIISSSELKALYFLGRLDYVLFAGHLMRGEEKLPEFSASEKLGRPVISTAGSLAVVISCYSDGLVLAEPGQWRTPWGVTPEAADYLEANCRALNIESRPRLLAFRWEGQRLRSPEACAALRGSAVGAGP
jgi:hypothetical protein